MLTKYKYTSLKDIQVNGDYHFYGIIYDASIPTQDEVPNQYICTLKLIDQDINCISFPDSLQEELIYVILKSNSKENLPYIHTFGDIIRIQRGKFVLKKKKKVYLNLTSYSKVKGNWTIFSSKIIS